MSDEQVNLWTVPVGVDADFMVSIVGSDGRPVEFTGDEPITVVVWQGDDAAPTPGLVTATWEGGDPAQGMLVASVLGSATATAAPDYHRTRITIAVEGREYLAYEGWLSLTASPGVGEVPRTYIGLKDLIDVGGDWLPALMSDMGHTSFLRDRARASVELEKVILSRCRPYTWADDPRWWGSWTDPNAPDARVSGLLADDRLEVTEQIREAVAYLAASYICERQITMDADDVYARRAAYYRAKWRSSLPGLTVAIDASNDGDGSYYMYIDLSVMSSR